MPNYNEDKDLSYLMYWDPSNQYGLAMSQKSPADSFKWKKSTSKFDENLQKNRMKIVIEDTYLK